MTVAWFVIIIYSIDQENKKEILEMCQKNILFSLKIVNALRKERQGGINLLTFAILGSLMLLSSFTLAANVEITGDTPPINTALAPHLTEDTNNPALYWFNPLASGDKYVLTDTSSHDGSSATNQFTTSSLGVGNGVTLMLKVMQHC